MIDDDELIATTLCERLKRESYAVDVAYDGKKGSYTARTNHYDVIILDNVLPKKSGLEVCKEIRESGKNTPIIVISVKSSAGEKSDFLDNGADDYIVKPFSFKELCSRIKAVLRRPYQITNNVYTIGDISVDTNKQSVKRNGEEIYLTRKEFLLFECLVKQNGAILSRGMIMERVWNEEGDPFSNTIEAHILNLRKKIDKGSNKKIIKTVPGRGYKIDPDGNFRA